MLSAALTLGSAVSSYAAPLAKKAGGVTAENQLAAKVAAPGDQKGKIMLTNPRLAKTVQVSGLHKVKSQLQAKRQAALKSATAAQRAAAAGIDLRGNVVYSDTWGEASLPNVSTIPTSEGGAFGQIAPLNNSYMYGSVDNGDGLYYCVSHMSIFGMDLMTLDTYDTDTWEKISSKSVNYDCMSLGCALDPVSGDIYGVYYAVEGQSLVLKWAKADYENGISIPIADFPVGVMSVGAADDGTFYALGVDLILYKVDKTTGQTEAVAQADLPSQYLSGGCVNTANNTYLQAYSTDTEAGLVEINLETGETVELCQYPDGEEIMGLYIPKPAAADKAPAAPGLTVVCDNGSMDVAIKVTMPTTLFDGTPASGQTFSYKVETGDGATVASGTAAAGAEVTETATLAASGMTKFIATVSNDAGTSPKAKAECFVGKGAPSAPANVKLAWANGTATLTWNAVTASSDGGFLDPAAVTYTVAGADGEIIASGLTATTFTQAVPLPASYTALSYSVKAEYDGKSSAFVASNVVGLGEFTTPLTMDMTDAANFAIHTIEDVNGDGKTWNFSSGTRYTYHSSNAANDWLFSPAVKLEGGKSYKISAVVAAQANSYAERIEVFMGQQPSSAAMTLEVIPSTDVVGTADTEIEAYVTPSATGIYHVGFHAISDANKYYLHLKSYSISAPISASAPEAVENVSVKASSSDCFKAEISFKAPSKTIAGDALTGNVKVKVLRGETLVAEESLAPGATKSLMDNTVVDSDTYTYSFIPVNAAGEEGKTVTVAAFIGAAKPGQAGDFAGYSAGNTVHLSWTAPTADADGNALVSPSLTYNVWSVEGGYLGEILNDAPITSTSYSFDIDVPAEQDFVQYAIQAVNYDVEGGASGALVSVGPAYVMPVLYSGGASLESYILGISGTGDASLGDASMGVAPYAGEDFFYAKFTAIGQTESFITGKIAVTGEAPVVMFREYKLSDQDTNGTVVSVICEGVTTELASYTHADLDTDVWSKRKCSLAQFKGKEVQLLITAVCNGVAYNLYDEINICEDINYDLQAAISAPATVETGAEFNVSVTIVNDGAEDSDSYTVNLYRNGEIVDTKTNNYGLAEGESDVMTFKQTLGLHDGDSAEYKAVVVYEADEVPDNNTTATVVVTRKRSTLPAVTGLAGEKTADGNSLTWDEIVIADAMPMDVTEDFESAEPFAKEFEGWTFVDGDGKAVGGFEGIDLPGIEPGTTTGSFFIFDNADNTFNESYNTSSGTKFLAALFNFDDSQVDDWAISPLLTGEAQTISFQARSYSADYPEKIEVWYTTDDSANPNDFVKVEAFGTKTLSDEFLLCTADLPAGAKHFAIRSCAAGAFMLMIDDVTYKAIVGFNGQLQGYNVYCDGVKLNDAPVAQASYLHATEDDAAHTYHVTAVYDKGESELSDPVTVGQSGVDSVLAAGLKISVEGQSIVVTGAEGKLVTINSVDGKTIYAAQGDARVAVNAAIYLVTVDRKTVKVAVR